MYGVEDGHGGDEEEPSWEESGRERGDERLVERHALRMEKEAICGIHVEGLIDKFPPRNWHQLELPRLGLFLQSPPPGHRVLLN